MRKKLIDNVSRDQMIDWIPSMAWLVRDDGYAWKFNQTWFRRTGMVAEDSEGLAWLHRVHADDRHRLLASIETVIQTGESSELEVRYQLADGQYRRHLITLGRIDLPSGTPVCLGIHIDIESKHALHEMSEAQTEAIVEAAVDGIITIDARGMIQSFNPAAERIFGYRSEEVIGCNVSMLMPEPDRSHHDQYVANYLQTGHKKIIGIGREVIGLRRDGSVFPMDLAVSELRLSDRRMFTGIVRDISERKQAEVQLRERERFLQAIYDAEPECVLVLARDSTIQMMNRAGLSMIDAESGSDLSGQSFLPLISDRYQEQFQRRIDRVFEGDSTVLEYKLIGLRGRRRVMEGHLVPLRDNDGTVTQVLAVSRDITSQRQAEREASEGQRKLSTLINNLPGAAYRRRGDQGLTMEYISDGCIPICGYYPADLLAGKPSWSQLIQGERESQRGEIQNAIAEQQPFQLSYRIRHRNGDERWVWEQGQGVFCSQGELLAIEGLMIDITERKQAERLAAMGQMLSGIAHESRNALQRIQAGADMLELELESNPEAQIDLRRITRAREDLNKLFEELRNFAAPIHLDKVDCPIAETWRRAWTHLESIRENRVAELVETNTEFSPVCRIDMFRMEQVFRNFLENSLAACTDPVEIVFDCQATVLDDTPAVRIRISDNGPGLSTDQQEKVFDAFYTTKTKGTGLGMAIARRIVEAHNGKIQVLDCGDGAEFEVVMPI